MDDKKNPDDLIEEMSLEEIKREIRGMINEDIERYVGHEKTISEDK